MNGFVYPIGFGMSVKGHVVGKMAFMNEVALVMSDGSLQKILCSSFVLLRYLMSSFSALSLNIHACVLGLMWDELT